MSDRRDRHYVEDICIAIERIQRYTDGWSRQQFAEDEKTQDAVIRNLEIIGEAAKSVSASTRRDNFTIPWKDLAGVRDKLIHQYFGVNFAIVWKIIKDELPPLLPELNTIQNTLAAQDDALFERGRDTNRRRKTRPEGLLPRNPSGLYVSAGMHSAHSPDLATPITRDCKSALRASR